MAENKDHRDPFWDADLKDIERSLLGDKDIMDLPIATDDRVPPQGNVLMQRVARLRGHDKVE